MWDEEEIDYEGIDHKARKKLEEDSAYVTAALLDIEGSVTPDTRRASLNYLVDHVLGKYNTTWPALADCAKTRSE